MSEKKVTELYDYQKECLDVIEGAGSGRHVVAIATGLGKTVIFSHIKRNGRTLILSHRDELVHQPEKYYDCSYGVEKADEHSNGEEVVSASVQTLSGDARLARFSPDDFGTIIVDECHHAAAPTYKKVLNYFTGADRVLGFTATPKRGDGVKLNDVFDDIIFTRDLKWGIENGYLTRLRSVRATADFNLSAVSKLAGDYSPEALENVLLNGNALAVTEKTFMDMAYNEGKHTLIYCVSKKLCRMLLDMIRKDLPSNEKDRVCMLTGDTPGEERADMLDKFSKGEIMAIINCMVLTEGTDLPIADCIINMRPTCNASLYQQIVGRGTRLCSGKNYCLIIDILPKDGHDRNLCSAPTLFGIDPDALDQESKKKVEDGQEDLLDMCSAISSSMSEIAQNLEVRIENTDLFLNGISKMAGDAGNILEFARRFNESQLKRSAEHEWDFQGMAVIIDADEATRYRIKPNWDDMIYISEPDILGNSRIEVHVKNAEEYGFAGSHVFSKTMKMEDAVSFAKTYCLIQDEKYRYSWDADTQKHWTRMPATSNQMNKLSKCYDGMTSLDGIYGIDKLSASRLIQLYQEYEDKNDFRKILADASKPRKSKKKEEAEEKLRLHDKMLLEDRKEGEQDFDRFEDKVVKISRNEDVMDVSGDNRNKLKVPLHYSYYSVKCKTCSDSQLGYVNGLISHLASRGIFFTDLKKGTYSSRRASVLIDVLSFIKNGCRKSGTGTIVFDDMEEFLERIDIGEKPQYVMLSYQIVDNRNNAQNTGAGNRKISTQK